MGFVYRAKLLEVEVAPSRCRIKRLEQTARALLAAKLAKRDCERKVSPLLNSP
jgi:hypothetical protein